MKKTKLADLTALEHDTKKWGRVRHFGTETTANGWMYFIKVLATNEVLVMPKSDFLKEVSK